MGWKYPNETIVSTQGFIVNSQRRAAYIASENPSAPIQLSTSEKTPLHLRGLIRPYVVVSRVQPIAAEFLDKAEFTDSIRRSMLH